MADTGLISWTIECLLPRLVLKLACFETGAAMKVMVILELSGTSYSKNAIGVKKASNKGPFCSCRQ